MKVKRKANSDSEDEPDFKEGLQKFKGMGTIIQLPVESSEDQIQSISKPNDLPNSSTTELASTKPKVTGPIFKNKNSEAIRLRSLEARENQKKMTSQIISHSLGQVKNVEKKKSKMELFPSTLTGGDEVDDDFKIRPELEGKSGERILELKSKLNYDPRFKIDKRFTEESEPVEVGSENEAEDEIKKNLSILGSIVGKDFKSSKDINERRGEKKSIMVRYDPDAAEHKKFEVPMDEEKQIESKGKHGKNKKELEPIPEPILSKEKAVYKVSADIKELFTNESTFSFLNTFQTEDDSNEKEKDDVPSTTKIKKGDNQNGFWKEKNPFKYDSSDDEESEKKAGGKDQQKRGESHSVDNMQRPIEEENFFFKKNDKRFNGLAKFFLVEERGLKYVMEHFDETRMELKKIARSKKKNSIRKIEKKKEAMKRKKRQMKQEKKNSIKKKQLKIGVVKS